MEIKFRLTDSSAGDVYQSLQQVPWEGTHEIVIREVVKGKRTSQQNNAAHLWISQLAAAMADGGLDMRTAIHVPIVPTPENIKETIIRPVLIAMYPDKTSTTQLSKVEISDLYEQVNAITAERWGISILWPSMDSMI